MDNIRSNHLEELKGSDFQIVEGMPDIQGWKIVDSIGEKVGKVGDMLFDKNARKVRYIITKLEGDQEVLIPIGKAQLDIHESKVIIQGSTLAQLAGLPTYTKDNLTAEDEHAIQNLFSHYAGEGAVADTRGDTTYDKNTFYDNEDFNQDSFYNKSDYTSNDSNKNQNTGTDDYIDRTDELDQTGNLNDRRNTFRSDDDPIEGDVNNPLKL